jgi:hypothetical protein
MDQAEPSPKRVILAGWRNLEEWRLSLDQELNRYGLYNYIFGSADESGDWEAVTTWNDSRTHARAILLSSLSPHLLSALDESIYSKKCLFDIYIGIIQAVRRDSKLDILCKMLHFLSLGTSNFGTWKAFTREFAESMRELEAMGLVLEIEVIMNTFITIVEEEYPEDGQEWRQRFRRGDFSSWFDLEPELENGGIEPKQMPKEMHSSIHSSKKRGRSPSESDPPEDRLLKRSRALSSPLP